MKSASSHDRNTVRGSVFASAALFLGLGACAAACGMRSELFVAGTDAGSGPGASPFPSDRGGMAGSAASGGSAANGGRVGSGGATAAGGTTARGSTTSGGGSTSLDARAAGGQAGTAVDARPASGGSPDAGTSTLARGGAGGSGGAAGTSARGGTSGSGGAATRDAAVADSLVAKDTAAPGMPTIDPISGYTTVSTGAVTMSGYVSSYIGGSGSSIGLSYTSTSFCATGTVGASATYNAWAGAGFNVNQAKTGSSGSTSSLVLTGSTVTVRYVNHAGSPLEFQLWDGSNYWCYYLPAATTANAVTIPFSSLNTQCWNGSGTAFQSGTSITTVQIDVPGAATTPTPFDYCFLGLTVD